MVRGVLEVVSYNVLCGRLGETHLQAPKALRDPVRRMGLILRDLEPFVQRRAVICLQEVGNAWAGPFSSFFQKNDYHMIYSGYGTFKNDFMGVALCLPNDRFILEDSQFIRPTDSKVWPKPKKNQSYWIVDRISNFFAWIWKQIQSLTGIKEKTDPWEVAKWRVNTLLVASLKCKESGKKSVVSTYHMPCSFWSPPSMVIHSALALQVVQAYAKDIPYIFCGDFNVKPGDASYILYTEGKLDSTHPDYPPPRDFDSWKPEVHEAVRSAYKECLGKEPEFTNHGNIFEEPLFTGTLDYVFYSPSKLLKVLDVLPLPSLSQIDQTKPLLSLKYPSDHLVIGAKFEML